MSGPNRRRVLQQGLAAPLAAGFPVSAFSGPETETDTWTRELADMLTARLQTPDATVTLLDGQRIVARNRVGLEATIRLVWAPGIRQRNRQVWGADTAEALAGLVEGFSQDLGLAV